MPEQLSLQDGRIRYMLENKIINNDKEKQIVSFGNNLYGIKQTFNGELQSVERLDDGDIAITFNL